MAGISSLCVYCGSRVGTDPGHGAAARRLGVLLAEAGVRLVYGGGRIGLMGVLADAVLDAGGAVTGVIPDFLEKPELVHPRVADMIVVPSMHARKHRMFVLSDAFAALPGGTGTLDETIEVITWKQLGLHDKPIVLVANGPAGAGYWAPFQALIEHIVGADFAGPEVAALYSVVESVDDLLGAASRALTEPPTARQDRL
ncbi:MAG: TIGR00730 family Rossman fold protein [Alphaproteobacteria bacterium]|jgi:hypothetical protein|nr:TIGR00730 family Rossman fold protein [Alphaproteobacteria bacterium]MDP6518186.1 TIGR00730 family Rossman fold protein [Alphaproteobacteria bacterium]